MPSQPVPEVTDEDVRRIAHRDFGATQLSLVLSVLDEFGTQKWDKPTPRVRLAILKMAQGDLDRLRQATRIAVDDYRDALSAAEYPRYMREIGFSNVLPEVAQKVIDADWREYREWLERE